MNKIEEMILELYNNENISIGVHGTGILPDEEQGKAKKVLEDGLMCRYGDIRRTVALQDRGYIHAHGNISFDNIIAYGYGSGLKGYIYEEKNEEKRVFYIPKEIDLEHCSFLVGIPKDMKTTDENLFLGDKKRFKMEYARTLEELQSGTYKELIGRVIDPRYIIGYYMNGDINTFKYNTKFYGFKDKENDSLEVDLEKIQEENEKIKEINEQGIQKSTQDLGRETIEEQRQTNLKDAISNVFNKLTSLVRGNPDRMRDD